MIHEFDALVKALADTPEECEVHYIPDGERTIIKIRTAYGEGRRFAGDMHRALRQIVISFSAKLKHTFFLEARVDDGTDLSRVQTVIADEGEWVNSQLKRIGRRFETLTPEEARMIVGRAGDRSDDIRGYLLGMCGDAMRRDTKEALR